MKRIFLCLFLIIFLNSQTIFSVTAQSDTCFPSQVAEWRATTEAIVVDYRAIDINIVSIETVSALQKLRQRVEEIDRPSCEETDNEYSVLIRLINFAADSIVSRLMNEPVIADDLFAKAEIEYQLASELLSTRPDIEEVVTEITSPKEGDSFPTLEVLVSGTYDPTTLGENALWVFHVPLNELLYFPQSVDRCTGVRTGVTLRPKNSDWVVTAYVGDPQAGASQQYEIVLMEATLAANQALNEVLDDACLDGTYPSFTLEQLDEMEFTPTDTVRIARD